MKKKWFCYPYLLWMFLFTLIPMALILGDNEKNNNTISYRLFGQNETVTMEKEEFLDYLKKINK